MANCDLIKNWFFVCKAGVCKKSPNDEESHRSHHHSNEWKCHGNFVNRTSTPNSSSAKFYADTRLISSKKSRPGSTIFRESFSLIIFIHTLWMSLYRVQSALMMMSRVGGCLIEHKRSYSGLQLLKPESLFEFCSQKLCENEKRLEPFNYLVVYHHSNMIPYASKLIKMMMSWLQNAAKSVNIASVHKSIVYWFLIWQQQRWREKTNPINVNWRHKNFLFHLLRHRSLSKWWN